MIQKLERYHPDDRRYIPYWSDIKRKCIEGLWGNEFGGYRYCPGRLFFYGNFGTILHVNEEEKVRYSSRPLIRDIEWERAYMLLEAEGFSGWSEDDEYTSDNRYEQFKVNPPDLSKFDPESSVDSQRLKSILPLYNKEGKLKKYISPRENIRKIHDKPKGVPIYFNSAKNILELGSRGGGKSFWYSIGVALHAIIFDGAKYYTTESIEEPNKVEVVVGAGQVAKSSEFCKKIEDAMQAFAKENKLGVWGKLSDDDYEPSIFYKEMAGTLSPNNKDNLWRNEYKVSEGGREIIEGTGSYIAHVVYSPQKTEGAQAAAGGRYSYVIYEEIGLLSLLQKAWLSNTSTVGIGATKFGVQIGLGTSGNMETILPAKEIFLHPKTYDLVSFNDDWEESGEIGFFLPAYITAPEFKDSNGNTDFDSAIDYFLKKREDAANVNNPSVLAAEKMNNPLIPSDMWQTDKSSILPVAEAQVREKELMHNKLYEKNYTPIKLLWDSSKPNGVTYEIDKTKQPFFEHKFRYDNRLDLDAPIMIYDFPQEIHGTIPDDMYMFIGHDPFVADNPDEGESLGATYVLMNPKYANQGFNGNTIVASYIAKPNGGRKEYYQNLEKLIAFYGNPPRGLWYEAIRGDECKNYFINKNKTYLLAPKPQRTRNASAVEKRFTSFGFDVGSNGNISKVDVLIAFSEWLLDSTTISGDKRLNIERIPCIFLIRQIINFDIKKGNFDAISAMLGIIIGLREHEYSIINEASIHQHNPLAFLSSNQRVFKDLKQTRFQQEVEEDSIETKKIDWQNIWKL